MIAWHELHIQSNIPLIVLAVSLLCLAIIGFLEFKKFSNRMDEINIELNQLKSSMNSVTNPVLNHVEKKGKEKNKEKDKDKEKEDEISEGMGEIVGGIEQYPQMNELDMMKQMISEQGSSGMIIGGMMPPPNMVPGGIASMIIGGQMGNMNMHNVYEEDITGNHLNIQEEQNDNLEEMIDEKLSECSLEDKKMKDFETPDEDDFSEEEEEEEEEEESESESESESEDEDDEVDGIELIQGKGKVEEVKEVSRSLSIKELKEICQKMDLSTSGNKETLVKRINSKK